MGHGDELSAGVCGVSPRARFAGIAAIAALASIAALAAASAEAAEPCPNEAIRAQQGSTHLPNCRAFELVTPVDKGPSGSVSVGLAARHPLVSQASEDGGSFVWPLQNGLPDTTAGGWLRMKAARTAGGWLSQQVSPPSLIPPPEVGGGFAEPSAALYASPDLGCALVETFQPLTEDISPASPESGMRNLFRWDAADGSYELISNRLPLNPDREKAPLPTFYFQIEASDDCERIYFESGYDFFEGDSGQYEWREGTLRDAGVLPDGAVGESVVRGGEVSPLGSASWNAVSPDGSRLFFTAIPNEGTSTPDRPAVFMREIQPDGGALVTEISESKTAVATNGARYEAASPDGSRVFFRANYGIAGTASSGPTSQKCGPIHPDETIYDTNLPIEPKHCDLYAYEVETGALTDLSAHTGHPEGAQIQGTVAVDEDGSHVYFAALGRLVPDQGSTYEQNVANETANVYLSAGGALSYVATLKGAVGDSDLVNGVLMRHAGNWTAKTSADGGELLFTSTANLTGYDSGGGLVAYLWSADTGAIHCVSCPPDGSPTLPPPSGSSGDLLAKGERRSLSADGSRVFFTSADPLAPGAVAGKRNLYQWEEGQVSFLAIGESLSGFSVIPELAGYRGADAEGETAFLATNERLAPQDRDFIGDVYAVRVDGGFLFEPPPPPCQADDSAPLEPNQIRCRVIPSAQPADAPPASAAPLVGSGNVTPDPCRRRARRAQRLSKRAKALRRRARRAAKASNGRAARRNAKRARRAARAARRNSKAAKRCRLRRGASKQSKSDSSALRARRSQLRRARAADVDRGGAR